MTQDIRVMVSGRGKMGTLVVQAVKEQDDLALAEHGGVFNPRQDPLGSILAFRANVVVDFTNATVTERLLPYLIEKGVHPVIGTSGLSDELIQSAINSCNERGLGGVIAPNFSLGSVLMTRFAKKAAPLFESAEVTETHHYAKVDAPSGTAIATAQQMRQARGHDFERNEPQHESLPGARGAEYGGVSIHSQRLHGAVAHQEVVFGGTGELLTIRHDSISRESFIPQILYAIRTVRDLNGLVVGLDQLLDL